MNLFLYYFEDKVILLATEWQQSREQGVVLIINIACYAEKDVKITFSSDAMRFPPNLPNDWKRSLKHRILP